jgi:transposase
MSRIITSIGIKGYKVLNHIAKADALQIDLQALSKRPKACIRCGSRSLQSKGPYTRTVRHLESFGRIARLKIRCRRFRCKSCVRSFVEPLPGILPGRHSTEPFRQNLYTLHHEGIPSSVMGRLKKVAPATVSRIYSQFTARKASERLSLECPSVLGIDEHTLHKKKQFATTFCDLGNRRVFDIVPGKSASDLEGFLSRLNGREKVKMVCIDLCSAFRSLVRRYFPNAILVADRFHVVRVVSHHFIQLARNLAPTAFVRRGIGGLLRKGVKKLTSSERERLQRVFKNHPVLTAVHAEMHEFRRLLNEKHHTVARAKRLVPRLLSYIKKYRAERYAPMQTLAKTLHCWRGEIAAMWRFTKNNGITEGFHRKMKLIQRRAYGFRNFENYRQRVIAACG